MKFLDYEKLGVISEALAMREVRRLKGWVFFLCVDFGVFISVLVAVVFRYFFDLPTSISFGC